MEVLAMLCKILIVLLMLPGIMWSAMEIHLSSMEIHLKKNSLLKLAIWAVLYIFQFWLLIKMLMGSL